MIRIRELLGDSDYKVHNVKCIFFNFVRTTRTFGLPISEAFCKFLVKKLRYYFLFNLWYPHNDYTWKFKLTWCFCNLKLFNTCSRDDSLILLQPEEFQCNHFLILYILLEITKRLTDKSGINQHVFRSFHVNLFMPFCCSTRKGQ